MTKLALSLVLTLVLAFFVLFLFLARAPGSGANYTCEDVKNFVSLVGRAEAERMAKERGMTFKQRRKAIACLKDKDKTIRTARQQWP